MGSTFSRVHSCRPPHLPGIVRLLSQAYASIAEKGNKGRVQQKEKRALEEKETGFADQVQRQKLIASLPSTFDVVFLIYQSRKRSVLNKQELVDKIMESNPKIVDKGEIEEQLRLLQEFVPEWISEKTGLSGDVLCRVDTALSQSEIRQRLQGVE